MDNSLNLYVTGFGKFADILENPTTYIVRELQRKYEAKELEVNIKYIKIVEVSIQDCDEALEQIVKVIQQEPEGKHLIVHFGVAEDRDCYSIEHKAKNIMDFGCPDERGNNPLNTLICDKSGECRETSLKVDEICQSLISGGHPQTKKSSDAGEYICNYMFYKAL